MYYGPPMYGPHHFYGPPHHFYGPPHHFYGPPPPMYGPRYGYHRRGCNVF